MLGRPLGMAPKFKFTLRISPENEEPILVEVVLGQSIELRDDDKFIAKVEVVGIHEVQQP